MQYLVQMLTIFQRVEHIFTFIFNTHAEGSAKWTKAMCREGCFQLQH